MSNTLPIFFSSGFVSSCVGVSVASAPSGVAVHGVDEEEGERDVGEIYYTGANNKGGSRLV